MTEYCQKKLERWLESPKVDEHTKAALRAMKDEEQSDCFYRDLEFGTGGLRGVLGPGDNRMNVYTVSKATQGLANYLNATTLPKRVAISYDSRVGSELFAHEAACVLAANKIVAWVYPRLEPTPALSFAARDLGCGAGICITASHNPAKYNGYKVYGEDGCQIALEVAAAVQNCIEAVDIFEGVRRMSFEDGKAAGLIRMIGEDTLNRFIQAVKAQALEHSDEKGKNVQPLKLVYTPLNGTGLECVTRILKEIGITDVTVVPEQEKPDGNFPTCP